MKVFIMKTYQEWSERFLQGDPEPFVAIDEPGVDVDYGNLSEAKKKSLFNQLEATSDTNRKWGLIKTFFDRFYDKAELGDLLVLGTGQVSKFNVTAIVRIIGEPYYVDADTSADSRHRRKVEILWQGDPFPVKEWGWTRRIQVLDTKERLEEFIKVYTDLV